VTWQTLLATPTPGQHIAQLYSDAAFLERAVAHFVIEGVGRGEAIIVIATDDHWQAVADRLRELGLDLDGLTRSGQLTVRDAATCLDQILLDGMPDRERFRTVVAGAVEAARAAGYRDVRAFGEMVDLLRRTDLVATALLEDLWNELLAEHRLTLLCGYSVDVFQPRLYGELLCSVCAKHSHLIPAEDYARLEQAVDGAFTDVFGPAGDAGSLRRAFLAEYVRPAEMPDAAAAILAIREFVPAASAALLERARHHYGHD
jgi:hypothetical protein